MGQTDAPNGGAQPQGGGLGGFLPGIPGIGGASDTREGLLGQQNNNIYNQNNNVPLNPFAAALNPLQNNQVLPNQGNTIGPQSQPIHLN